MFMRFCTRWGFLPESPEVVATTGDQQRRIDLRGSWFSFGFLHQWSRQTPLSFSFKKDCEIHSEVEEAPPSSEEKISLYHRWRGRLSLLVMEKEARTLPRFNIKGSSSESQQGWDEVAGSGKFGGATALQSFKFSMVNVNSW
ncbi:hypothetical protein Q3G72_032019 [Acer saccharum]|nr:hypothetical protein Q3G72_032019 [Acer saccharum]